MGGDYVFYQSKYQKFAADVVLSGAAVSATAAQAVASASHTIFVQRIVLSITTHAATKVFTVQDSAGTPVVIASRTDLAAAAGVPDVIVWDFGPAGFPLTEAKDLNYVANAGGSGFVGVFHIEGYQKVTKTLSVS